MGKSRKHQENLQRIQNVLDDKHEKKVQSGYMPETVEHKLGDKWTDVDGVRWEQKNGYRSQRSKVTKGMWDTCNECITPILRPWDKHMYIMHGKCRYCQINFEAKLRSWPKSYVAWIRLKELQNMEQIEAEMEAIIFETHEENQRLWDRSVVNALTNENINTNNVKL
jgi:hypothetical protein